MTKINRTFLKLAEQQETSKRLQLELFQAARKVLTGYARTLKKKSPNSDASKFARVFLKNVDHIIRKTKGELRMLERAKRKPPIVFLPAASHRK